VVRIASYRDLIAWQKAMELVNAVYRVTRGWPANEQFGLISQARRAAVSVPANIAEGQGRLGSAELRHHVSIAHGSLCELETLFAVAVANEMLNSEDYGRLSAQTDEVGRLLRGLLRSLPQDKSHR
jgi:four helix bundle protein